MGRVLFDQASSTGQSRLVAYETRRRCGGRVQIQNAAGEVLFDSGEHYDMANAINAAEEFASKNEEIL